VTLLFFCVTDNGKRERQKLAAVEATQSMEVLFTVAGEFILLASPFPSALSWCGMFIVMFGMVSHSYASHKSKVTDKQEVSA
jgi:hypothetical protein